MISESIASMHIVGSPVGDARKHIFMPVAVSPDRATKCSARWSGSGRSAPAGTAPAGPSRGGTPLGGRPAIMPWISGRAWIADTRPNLLDPIRGRRLPAGGRLAAHRAMTCAGKRTLAAGRAGRGTARGLRDPACGPYCDRHERRTDGREALAGRSASVSTYAARAASCRRAASGACRGPVAVCAVCAGDHGAMAWSPGRREPTRDRGGAAPLGPHSVACPHGAFLTGPGSRTRCPR